MVTGFVLYTAIRAHDFAVDFHNGEWPAGQRLLHGLSPYFAPHSAAVLSAGAPHPLVTPFVYPAVGAVMYALLALIPHYPADALFTAFDMAAVVGTLKLMDVRDWRLYGLVFLWPAVVIGWQTANITLLLVLGVAAVWRYRDRPAVSALVLALVVSVKIVVWPIAVWLLATRRYRLLAYACVWGVIVNGLAWAVVGYNQLPRYLSVLQSFTHAGERRAYSVVNLALRLGFSTGVATTIAYSLTAILAILCLVNGRARRERVAFILSIAMTIVVTPVNWLHYFALLIVPIAVVRRRLGLIWFLPLLMVGCPPTEPNTRDIAIVLGISAVVLGVTLYEAVKSGESEASSSGAAVRAGTPSHPSAELAPQGS